MYQTSSVSHNPMWFSKRMHSCCIVPHITKIQQNFWLTHVYIERERERERESCRFGQRMSHQLRDKERPKSPSGSWRAKGLDRERSDLSQTFISLKNFTHIYLRWGNFNMQISIHFFCIFSIMCAQALTFLRQKNIFYPLVFGWSLLSKNPISL